MAHYATLPEKLETPVGSSRWMVVIFNNDTNSFDEVVRVLVMATGCTANEAEMEAWEAHHLGKAPVHFESEEKCQRVADIIASVGVKTEVVPEWRD